jgi:hypothetical protein
MEAGVRAALRRAGRAAGVPEAETALALQAWSARAWDAGPPAEGVRRVADVRRRCFLALALAW